MSLLAMVRASGFLRDGPLSFRAEGFRDHVKIVAFKATEGGGRRKVKLAVIMEHKRVVLEGRSGDGGGGLWQGGHRGHGFFEVKLFGTIQVVGSKSPRDRRERWRVKGRERNLVFRQAKFFGQGVFGLFLRSRFRLPGEFLMGAHHQVLFFALNREPPPLRFEKFALRRGTPGVVGGGLRDYVVCDGRQRR